MNLYKIKQCCESMRHVCKITKNRIIEVMCRCDKSSCKLLGEYNNRLLCLEKLCEAISCCCCDLESVSVHLVKEYENQCNGLNKLIEKINNDEKLSKKEKQYLRCNEICKLCKSKLSRSLSKKK